EPHGRARHTPRRRRPRCRGTTSRNRTRRDTPRGPPPGRDSRDVRICVAGSLTVEDGEAVLRERDLPGNQGRPVLAMLAVEHRHPLSRDQLADELWREGLPRSWETALRAVVSKVRAAFERAGLRPMIESAFGCYQLHVGNGTLDLELAADALHRA